jgi:hypothetical protein
MIYGALFVVGVVLLFLLEGSAQADSPAIADNSGGVLDFNSGAYAPPPDDFTNAEIGDVISGGSGMPVTPDKIDLLARAIATAEGWTNSNPNVIPRRAHNPGDLTRAFGQDTIGVANSAGVLEFSDDNAGWSALKAEVTAMLTGASHVYSPTMTLRQVAAKYTGGDAADSWAANAARVLGISPDQTLKDFLAL